MTAILALETATDVVGCAVGIAGGHAVGNADGRARDDPSTSPVETRAAMLLRSERSHGEMLAPMIQSVLAEAEMSIADIDLIAVDCGPGRYTGLRVGIATAAALAYARSLPVAAVSSTELLAFGARKFNGYIVPVVDARRGEAFFAIYESTGENFKEIEPVSIATPSQLKQQLLRLEGRSLILGDFAFDASTDSLTHVSASYCENRPSPSSLAVLAAEKAKTGQVCEYSDLKSLYLRQPDINTARKSTAGDKTRISADLTRKAAAP